MNTNLDKLTAADLRHAADISEQIERLQAELAQLLSGKKKPGRKPGAVKPAAPATTKASKPAKAAKAPAKKKGKRPLSAAARKKMSEARRAYWANKKLGK